MISYLVPILNIHFKLFLSIKWKNKTVTRRIKSDLDQTQLFLFTFLFYSNSDTLTRCGAAYSYTWPFYSKSILSVRYFMSASAIIDFLLVYGCPYRSFCLYHLWCIHHFYIHQEESSLNSGIFLYFSWILILHQFAKSNHVIQRCHVAVTNENNQLRHTDPRFQNLIK